jgi:hypothetical protein
LLVVQDGPRADHVSDNEWIERTRAVLKQVDWPCEFACNFATENLGCKRRMASGISWAFDQVDRLIILEDDCLPHADFFPFCDNLLTRFANDERIMTISGDNFQLVPRSPHSYYFSKWTHIWGWASWRRAWAAFDPDIRDWPITKDDPWLSALCCEPAEHAHWQHVFDQQHAGLIDTWDFPWMYANWKHGGLTVLPNTNLVSNIGFGAGATHTIDAQSPLANLPAHGMPTLSHPPCVERDVEADAWSWRNVFQQKSSELHPAPTKSKIRRWISGWRTPVHVSSSESAGR